jgi:hypothetical protein
MSAIILTQDEVFSTKALLTFLDYLIVNLYYKYNNIVGPILVLVTYTIREFVLNHKFTMSRLSLDFSTK